MRMGGGIDNIMPTVVSGIPNEPKKYSIEPTDYNAIDRFIGNYPQLMQRARKGRQLIVDLIALHPKLGIFDDLTDIVNMPNDVAPGGAALADVLGGEVAKLQDLTDRLFRYPLPANIDRAFKRANKIIFGAPDIILDMAKFFDDFSKPVDEF